MKLTDRFALHLTRLGGLAVAALLLTGCTAQKRLIEEQSAAIESLTALNERLYDELDALQDSLQFYDDIDSGQYHRQLRQLNDRINKLEYELALSRDGGRTLETLLVDALFAPASATLTPAGRAQLDGLADTLAALADDAPIRIEGHSDNVPIGPNLAETYPSNWELSTARAAAVARYFMEQHELPAEQFVVLGFGPARPAASNATAVGRRQNRRVRIAIEAAPTGASSSPASSSNLEQP